jgi:hypothetical protein
MVLCGEFALACSDGEGRTEPMTPEKDTGWAALVDWDGLPSLGNHRYGVLASNERHDSVCGDRLEMLFQQFG